MQPVALAYMSAYPSVGLPLVGGGTTHGYKSAIDGTTDIGMVSGTIESNLAKWAAKQNIKLKQTDIAYDGLAIFVHPSNKLTNLTLAQLKDVFAGNIQRWDDLGFANGSIQVYSQNPNRGSFETLRHSVLKNKENVTVKAKMLDGLDMVTAVANDPQAIGFSSPFIAQQQDVKILSIDGAFVTPENLQNNKYPLKRALALVTKTERKELVQKFIDYCTSPSGGQKIIAELGLVPLASSSK